MKSDQCDEIRVYTIKKGLFWVLFFFLAFFLSFFVTLEKGYPQSPPGTSEIIFFDNFDLGKLETRWLTGKSKAVTISYDPRHVHSGCCSMEVTALPGKGVGGMARTFFKHGYDKVYVRWYCKFDNDFDQGNLMHLNKLIASKKRWAATAGRRPNGFDFFRTTLDVWRNWRRNPPPGEPVLYSYFPSMKKDRKTGKYYGNLYKGRRKVLIRRGRWYCMEMMLQANFSGRKNGAQAFWINGKLIGHVKNIVWRFTNGLKINSFMLGLYIHDNRKINRMWYDDVVVSTGYIGP